MIKLFLIVGESNAAGYAQNHHIDSSQLARLEVVEILNNETLRFEPLRIGINNQLGINGGLVGTEHSGHGLEVGLAEQFVSGRIQASKVFIVKAGFAGARVCDWLEESGERLWPAFLDRVEAAKAELSELEWEPILICSMGVNDALAGAPPDLFKHQLSRFILRIKSAVPVSRVLLTTFQPPIDVGNVFNPSISQLAEEDPSATVIDTFGLTLRDAHHWDCAGFLEMSRRIASTIGVASDQIVSASA